MSDRWNVCILEPAKPDAPIARMHDFTAGSEFSSRDAQADALNDFVSSSANEWLVFLAERHATAFREHSAQIAAAMAGQADQALLLVPLVGNPSKTPLGASSATVLLPMSLVGLAGIWECFPAQLAALIQPPEMQAAVFIRRSAFVASEPFRNVPLPVWDRVAELAVTAGAVAVLDAPRIGSNHGQIAIDFHELPALSPQLPGAEKQWLKKRIRAYEVAGVSAKKREQPDTVALKAGLFQIHDFLDESHAESQKIEGEGKHRSGDYWHGILHRREPDPANAKYWFRQVERHPVFGRLAELAQPLLTDSGNWRTRICSPRGWDPAAFIDLCDECQGAENHPLEAVARGIQWAEMLLLLGHTLEDALTST